MRVIGSPFRLLWLLLTYEAPKKRYNFWHYQFGVAGLCLCSIVMDWAQPYPTWQAAFQGTTPPPLPLWLACLLGYLGARVFFAIAKHTPFAKPELME